MNIKRFLTDVVITFAATLVVALLVSFVYSLMVHGAGTLDGGTALRLAAILGIVLPLTRARSS